MAPQFALSPDYKGIFTGAPINLESLEKANELLKKNHDEWHIFFRDRTGHNHTAHSILTCLALGATPAEIQRAYDDTAEIQRPIPEVDQQILDSLDNDEEFFKHIGTISLYTTFLTFFERQIDEKGWKAVVSKYCFSRTKVADQLFCQLYEGIYHPIIHLGFGIEFGQPAIVAEALAQAASHDDNHISKMFFTAEKEAQSTASQDKSLIELLYEVKNNKTIVNAPEFEQRENKMRDGVMAKAAPEISAIAAQWRVTPETLDRRTAEMISVCAFYATAAQRPGWQRKIDFFYMHAVTSSIFFSIFNKQDWIKPEDKARLVEWKGRLDLAWYAFSGSADLDPVAITSYSGVPSGDMDWDALYAAGNKVKDDGHVVKYIRALKNGQEAAAPYEDGPYGASFPVKGDMWIKSARLCLDSTPEWPFWLKWIAGAGFPAAWEMRPELREKN